MEKLKWQYRLFGYYFQMTMEKNFVILSQVDGQWRNVYNLNFNNKIKRLKCYFFGHIIDIYLVEQSKTKECKRCEEKLTIWRIETVDDYLKSTEK